MQNLSKNIAKPATTSKAVPGKRKQVYDKHKPLATRYKNFEKKDAADWRFEAFQQAVSMCGSGQPEIELFADTQRHNALLLHSFNPEDDAFGHTWTNNYYYGNGDYTDDFLSRMLRKALSDFYASPTNTKFMFIIPDWKSSSWYSLLRYFEIKKTYPSGTSDLFSAKSIAEINPTEKQRFTPDGRVFVGPTKWSTLVIYIKIVTQ